VAFGEIVHCHIARFVVVWIGKGLVYACAISTYGNQGTKKKACNPAEHAIIHLLGDIPRLLPGEPLLTKRAIAVRPSSTDIPSFSAASRVRFGRLQAFQSNIKAKDLGDVVEEHIPLLIEYWQEEMEIDCFEAIRKPRAFFNRGRIFMVLWPKMSSIPDAERAIHLKIRRFVCIRPRTTSCLCLPIHTYRGQATTKRGVSEEEHAPVVPLGGHVQLHPNEKLSNKPLYIKVEDPNLTIDPMSRLNFGSVSTVEHNLKVRNVGRLVAESVKQLEEYFVESMKLDRA
ncbi:hypothetical protein BDV96DRAFT_656362, partial [Lophiotrema nucula]